MGWRFVLSLLFALVVALFALQNAGTVEIRFLVWELTISQALIILVSAIFGAFTVMMLSLIRQLKLKAAIKSDKKTIASLENEVSSLKKRLESGSPAAGEPSANGAFANSGPVETLNGN